MLDSWLCNPVKTLPLVFRQVGVDGFEVLLKQVEAPRSRPTRYGFSKLATTRQLESDNSPFLRYLLDLPNYIPYTGKPQLASC